MSIGDLAVALGTVLLPGLAATAAAFPPRAASIPLNVACVVVLGYGTASLVAMLLAIVGILGPVTFGVTLTIVTLALLYAAWLRGRPGDRAKAFMEEIRADPVIIATGIAVIVGLAIFHLRFSPMINFNSTAPWRYWADALEIADVGGMPDSTLQWGSSYVPTVSKLAFNSFNAAISFIFGNELQALGFLQHLWAAGLVASLWAFGFELGLRRLSAAIPILVLFNESFLSSEMVIDIQWRFTAENVGRMVALCALAIAMSAVRERKGWTPTIVAGLTFGVAAGTHLVPTVIAIAGLAWYTLARFVIDRQFVAIAWRSVATVGVAALLLLTGVALAGGDVGFQGAGGRDKYAEIFGPNFDPTRFFSTGQYEQREEFHPSKRSELNGGWYDPPGTMFTNYMRRSTELKWSMQSYQILIALAFVASIAMLFWFPKEAKPAGLTVWGIFMSVLIVTLAFSFLYETQVPARFGDRRLADYGALPTVLFFFFLGEGVLGFLGRLLPKRARLIPSVAGALVVAILAVSFVPDNRPPQVKLLEAQQSVEAITWIRANIPCDARILTSRRTAGTFEATTGRVNIVEGMAPYLRPEMLERVVEILIGAKRFFRDPAASEAYLRDESVDYVVLIKGDLMGSKGALLGEVDPDTFLQVVDSKARFLDPLYRSVAIDVYRVTGASDDDDTPDPSDSPGYTCKQTPLRRALS